MELSTVSLLPMGAAQGDASPKPKDAKQAAHQFEALLIQQMLQAAHDSEEESSDNTRDTMWGFAAQQFSQILADAGGLGLTSLILSGLNEGNGEKQTGTQAEADSQSAAGSSSSVATTPVAGSR